MTKKPGRPDYGNATPEDLAQALMRPTSERQTVLSNFSRHIIRLPTRPTVKTTAQFLCLAP